ncbi:MAG: hypothetical protein JXR63_04040 [Spirochaetales bacterium]|nr:hypothetical protein [Spirochaetales bacterium]
MGLKLLSNKTFFLIILLFISVTNLQAQGNPFLQGNRPENTQKITKNESKLQQKSKEFQKIIREKIAYYIKEIKHEKNAKILLFSCLLSLLYGILHAIGPGHRKIVMFSYFVTNKSKLYEPWLAGFAMSTLHALGAIVVVSIVYFTIKASLSTTVDKISNKMEFYSYLSIALLGIFMLLLAIIELIKKIREHKNPSLAAPQDKSLNRKKLILLILTTGPIPCPGASLILIMSITNDAYMYGILLVVAMSIGMGLTISLLGSIADLSKKTFNYFANYFTRKNNLLVSIAHPIVEIIGALVILAFGIFMIFPTFF